MKILKKSPLLLLGTAFLASSFSTLSAVETDPVGFSSMTITSGYNAIGITFVKPAVFTGKTTAASATTLTVSGTPVLDLVNNTYYVEVSEDAPGSPAFVGERVDIASVSGAVITLDTTATYNTIASLDSLPAGAQVTIRPHFTIGDFSALIQSSINSDDSFNSLKSDQILLFDGSFKIHLFYAGKWYENFGNNEIADNKVVAPGTGFFYFRNPGAGTPSDIDFAFSGAVRMNDFVQKLMPGYQFVATGYPIEASPSDFRYSDVLQASPNFNQAESDLILTWDNGFKIHLLYDDGAGTKQWYQNFGNNLVVDDSNLLTSTNAMFVLIRNTGQALVVNRPF